MPPLVLQQNEDDIDRLYGATVALEKMLQITLTVCLTKPPPHSEDTWNMLIEKWEEALVRDISVLWQSTPQQREGYRLIHKGFLQLLQNLKKEGHRS